MTITTKNICHRDTNGNLIIIKSDSNVEYLGLCDHRVHWGWYVFWLIVFIPMIIVLLLHDYVSKDHLVMVDGVVYEGDKHTLKRIMGGK